MFILNHLVCGNGSNGSGLVCLIIVFGRMRPKQWSLQNRVYISGSVSKSDWYFRLVKKGMVANVGKQMAQFVCTGTIGNQGAVKSLHMRLTASNCNTQLIPSLISFVNSSHMPLKLDVYYDFSCPWCYVGFLRCHEVVVGSSLLWVGNASLRETDFGGGTSSFS